MASRHRNETDSISNVEIRGGRFDLIERKYDPKSGKRRKLKLYSRSRNLTQGRAMPMVIGLLTAHWDFHTKNANQEDFARLKTGEWQISVAAEDIAKQLQIRINVVKEIFCRLNLSGVLSQARHKSCYGGLRSEHSCWISDHYLLLKSPV